MTGCELLRKFEVRRRTETRGRKGKGRMSRERSRTRAKDEGKEEDGSFWKVLFDAAVSIG